MVTDSAALGGDTDLPRRAGTLARAGFALNGVLHLLIAVVTIALVANASYAQSSVGAVSSIASTPAGDAVMWSIAGGMLILALWQIVQTFLPWAGAANPWPTRVVDLGAAVAYLLVGGIAFSFVRAAGARAVPTPGGRLLALPGGVVVLTLIGLAIIVVGTVFIVSGASKKFVADLSLPENSAGSTVVTFGVVAYLAKGIVLSIVGILFVIASLAAIQNPTAGLDGAASHFVGLPEGGLLLVVVAVGLALYAMYCGIRAVRAR